MFWTKRNTVLQHLSSLCYNILTFCTREATLGRHLVWCGNSSDEWEATTFVYVWFVWTSKPEWQYRYV